ncbi:hypothetical protein OH492_07275 [Vibrio chagasii]|nr:hypothetical protein [Vibrio chagasii]
MTGLDACITRLAAVLAFI